MAIDLTALSSRLTSLLARVDQAARSSGRSLNDITLVAVSKTVAPPLIREAYRLGLRHFGENRVQEAEAKRPDLADLPEATWHLIGHLQTNKAKKALPFFDMFQSVDSDRVAEVLNRAAEEAGRTLPCLAEVKTSPEEAKHGLPPEDLERFLDQRSRWPHLSFQGLMTVAPFFEDPAESRPFFARLRSLAEKRKDTLGERPVLSMGMSHDFEAALAEGATMIRVGTALFGERS
jgi:PLP dependent protein